MHNVVQSVPPDIHTFIGTVTSISSYVLLRGAKHKRFTPPHASSIMEDKDKSLP